MISNLLGITILNQLLTIYPASAGALLLPIFIVVSSVLLAKHTGAAKSSLVFGIISLSFLTLVFVKDIVCGYYLEIPDLVAMVSSLIVALTAIVAGLITLLRIKLKINLKGRNYAIIGSTLGALTFVFSTVWLTLIIITPS